MKSISTLLKHETVPGILLLLSAFTALVFANSSLSVRYLEFFNSPLSGNFPGVHLPSSLKDWVNDLLMAVFFFVVGSEIKREILVGSLASRSRAFLPGFAALGGMVVPALIFCFFNPSGAAQRGWGIPMATDIAFSLGALSLLGKRVNPNLKVFLAALAIVDDLGAVLVIALFYTAALHPVPLLFALALILPFAAIRKFGRGSISLYLVCGAILWFLFLQSGVHSTIAGVLLAFAMPLAQSTALSHKLQSSVNFLIMPVFAFANAGERFENSFQESLEQSVNHPVGLGILLGLFLGKPIGISLFSIAAIKLRLAALPTGATYPQLFGVASVAGIGFTMSLFISSLAFSDPELQSVSKLAIMLGSFLSAIAGSSILDSTRVGRRELNFSTPIRSKFF